MRPSELLGLDDPYVQYCLDEAVWEFATSVQAEMDKVKHKKPEVEKRKREAVLKKYLGLDKQPGPPKFADPAAKAKKGS